MHDLTVSVSEFDLCHNGSAPARHIAIVPHTAHHPASMCMYMKCLFGTFIWCRWNRACVKVCISPIQAHFWFSV